MLPWRHVVRWGLNPPPCLWLGCWLSLCKLQLYLLTPMDHAMLPYTKQVALLSQRDRATCLSVEILQLQNIAIVWHYLHDVQPFLHNTELWQTHPHRRTDRYTTTACTALSIASRGPSAIAEPLVHTTYHRIARCGSALACTTPWPILPLFVALHCDLATVHQRYRRTDGRTRTSCS